MEISGKIIWAGQRRSGVSAQSGNNWMSQDFCLQNVSNGAYGTITTNIAFTVQGEDKLNQWNPQVGDEVTIGYGINAHEYNGRWYNDVKAFKYERKVQAQQPQYAQQPFPPQQSYQQGGYTQAPY